MNRALNMLCAISTTLLVACAGPNISVKNEKTASAIGICGGGIDDGIKANIEAEYVKLKGRVDASFSRYVKTIFNANDVSDEKYKQYIACVLEMDRRQRADTARTEGGLICSERCKFIRISCNSRSQSVHSECIADQINGCLEDCDSRGIGYDQCRGRFCAWTKMGEEGRSFYTDRCNRNTEYLQQIAACSKSFEQCLSSC